MEIDTEYNNNSDEQEYFTYSIIFQIDIQPIL